MNTEALASPRRRQLLLAGAAFTASVIAACPLARAKGLLVEPVRALSFDNTHTGEKLTLDYWADGSYKPEALQALESLLRDFRTGDLHRIDPRLYDQLWTVARLTGSKKPFEIICGYRTPATNRDLRAHDSAVALHSLHMEGKAIDVRLDDVPSTALRDAARSLKAGGVGYYADSDFVHLDTGRVRHW